MKINIRKMQGGGITPPPLGLKYYVDKNSYTVDDYIKDANGNMRLFNPYIFTYDGAYKNNFYDDARYNPWISNVQSQNEKGLYAPTVEKNLTPEEVNRLEQTAGYNYVSNSLFDESNNATSNGLAYFKATDKLLPNNSAAKYNNGTNTVFNRTNLDSKYRKPLAQKYATWKDYINGLLNADLEHRRGARYDDLAGARHNSYLNLGKRYFLRDANGKIQYVSPDILKDKGFTVSNVADESLSEFDKDKATIWQAYEVKPRTNNTDTSTIIQQEEIKQPKNNSANWAWLSDPDFQASLMGSARLLWDDIVNRNALDKYKAQLIPPLKEPKQFYRHTHGDLATQQSQYDQAAQIQSQMNQPYTADATLNRLSQLEGFNKAHQLKTQGDLADNQMIQQTRELATQQAKENVADRVNTANENRALLAAYREKKAGLDFDYTTRSQQNWDTFQSQLETRRLAELDAEKAKQDARKDQYEEYLVSAMIPTERYDALRNKLNNLEYGTPEYNRISNELILESKRINAQKAYLMAKRSGAVQGNEIYWERVLRNLGINPSAIDALTTNNITKPITVYNRNGIPQGSKLILRKGGVINKFEGGGFVAWTPWGKEAMVPAEVRTLSEKSSVSKSEKSEKSDSKKDLNLKDLADTVSKIDGLPVDVAKVSNVLHKFIDMQSYNLDGEPTADAYHRYLQALTLVNNVKNSANEYKNAYTQVVKNNGLNEAAINELGNVMTLNQQGDIKSMSPEKYLANKSKLHLVTNSELLYMRANDKRFANNDTIFGIVSNGIGIQQVRDLINKIAGEIGSKEVGQDMVYNPLKNGQQGIQLLKSLVDAKVLDSASGNTLAQLNSLVQMGTITKSQANQVKLAAANVITTLPNNAKALLILKAGGVEKAQQLILDILTANTNESQKFDIQSISALNPDGTLKSGKGSSDGSGSDDDVTKIKQNAATLFARGMGTKSMFTISGTGNQGIIVRGNSMPITSKEAPIGNTATLAMVSQSDFGGGLDMQHITMGNGSRIDPNAENSIIVNASKITAVELPLAPNSEYPKPWFELLAKKEKVDSAIRKIRSASSKLIDPDKPMSQGEVIIINKMYKNNGLPERYTYKGGKIYVNQLKYARFALLKGTTTENAFMDINHAKNDKWLGKVTDDNQRKNFESSMRVYDEKFELNNVFYNKDDVYTGTLFIPMSNDILVWQAAGGSNMAPTASQSIAMDRATQETERMIQHGGAKAKRSIIQNN